MQLIRWVLKTRWKHRSGKVRRRRGAERKPYAVCRDKNGREKFHKSSSLREYKGVWSEGEVLYGALAHLRDL